MNIYKISDKIVFNALNNIKFGHLEITNHNGELFKFGNPNDPLKANLIIKSQTSSLNLLKGEAWGLQSLI